jgi:hypothetical protein
MRRRAATLGLVGAAILAGCGALDPYPAPPRAAQPGAPAGPRVAICYNTLATSLVEVQAQAQQECSADTVAEPADTDWYLQSCPLLLPARATFVCRARK